MRAPLLALLLCALVACQPRSEEVLPISALVRSGSRVEAVAIEVRPTARAAVAALDQRARSREGAAALPLAELLTRRVVETSRAWGLTGAEPLRLTIELDALSVAGTGAALIGGEDRMAGTVFVRHAANGAALGQLYVDIDRRSAGLLGIALRGSGVREQLAEAFAAEIARVLSGRVRPPR